MRAIQISVRVNLPRVDLCLIEWPAHVGGNTILVNKYSKEELLYTYCRIQINSSVTHHGGYLTCWNMVIVTHHKGVLTKGLNCDNQPNMAILAPNRVFPSKWLILALAAYPAMNLTPNSAKVCNSTAITLTVSQLPKQGDERKISSGMSRSQRGVNLNWILQYSVPSPAIYKRICKLWLATKDTQTKPRPRQNQGQTKLVLKPKEPRSGVTEVQTYGVTLE